jgi:alcohol dehydrogenase
MHLDRMRQGQGTMEWQRAELRKFVAPEFVFGNGALHLVSRYLRHYGGSKAFIVSDSGVVAAGWADRVVESLEQAAVAYVLFDAVTPEPKAQEVMAGASLCVQHECDLVIAVGGGSVIDCAKGISIVCANQRHILEFEGIDCIPAPGAPLICVPTTGGAAADVSQFAIITDPKRMAKISIVSKALVPDVSLIDPVTTMTTSRSVTISAGFDALAHAFEAYTSNANSSITDLHALEAARLVSKHLPHVLASPSSLECREGMMLASLHAGLAFSNASLGITHAMSHGVGGMYGAPHGIIDGILLPYTVDFNFDAAVERYRVLGEMMGLALEPAMAPAALKDAIIARIYRFERECGFSDTFDTLGVRREHLPALAANAYQDVAIATNPRPASIHDIEAIYARALG